MTLGERRISASLMTFEFLGVGPNGHQSTADGARLLITHQGAFFEGSDGPAMREAGWRSIFDRLTSELA